AGNDVVRNPGGASTPRRNPQAATRIAANDREAPERMAGRPCPSHPPLKAGWRQDPPRRGWRAVSWRSEERRYRPVVVGNGAVPGGEVGVGAEIEVVVGGPGLQPLDGVLDHLAGRDGGQRGAGGGAEGETACGLRLDGEAALVDEAMVAGAEEDEVGEARVAAVEPVADVVAVEEAGVGAAGEAAAAVAQPQGAAQGGRYGAGSSAQ